MVLAPPLAMFRQSTFGDRFAQKPRPYPALSVWVESPIRSMRTVVPGLRAAAVAASNAFAGSPCASAWMASKPVAK